VEKWPLPRELVAEGFTTSRSQIERRTGGVLGKDLFGSPTYRDLGHRDPWSTDRSILPARGRTMLHQASQTEAGELEWSCQAVSHMHEPCDSAAALYCGVCGRWFCAVHFEDETWHTCALQSGDKGGVA
jgi:hypothetical protein